MPSPAFPICAPRMSDTAARHARRTWPSRRRSTGSGIHARQVCASVTPGPTSSSPVKNDWPPWSSPGGHGATAANSRRCAAPGPALPAPGSALIGSPGAPAPSRLYHATDHRRPVRHAGTALLAGPPCPGTRFSPRLSRKGRASRVPARSAIADREPGTPYGCPDNWRARPSRRRGSWIEPDVANTLAAPPPATPQPGRDGAARGIVVCTSIMAAASTHRYISFDRGSGYPARRIPAHLDPLFHVGNSQLS